MVDSKLTELFSIHLESIQESFGILAKQNSVPMLAKQFSQILSGNFFTTDVNIFYRDKKSTTWEKAFSKKTLSTDVVDELDIPKQFSVFDIPDNGSIAFSLPLTDATMFLVIMGKKLNNSGYSEYDKLSLQMFAQLLANAYQTMIMRKKEKELIFSLNHRIVQLNGLIDAGININRIKRIGQILTHGLEMAVSMTNASRGRVTMASKSSKRYYYFPKGLKNKDFKSFTSKIATDFTFQKQKFTFEIFDKESRSGNMGFEATDEIILKSLARQSHVAFENRELTRQHLAKQLMDKEVAVAGEIQQSLLPQELPEIKGYDIAGKIIPASTVGGDFYDCVNLPDGRYALVIADVTGHGISASLLVNSFHASLHSLLSSAFTLPDLIKKINKVIYLASPPNKFITAFLAILDPETGRIEYTSAGHNPAYLSTSLEPCKQLSIGGIMLGMLGFDIPMDCETVILDKGQRFLIYTDGIPEADDRTGDMYDEDRLEQFFIDHTKENSQQFVDALIDDVFKFTAGAPQNDDITALYIKRNS